MRSVAQFAEYRALGLGVMVGRGALGRPWVFAELRGERAPTAQEKVALVLEHARLGRAWYGSEHAIVKLRGQLLRYAEALTEVADFRAAFGQVTSLSELENLVGPYLERVAREVPRTSKPVALSLGGAIR